MLKLVKSDTFRTTVNACMPSNDPAKPVEGSFVATYRHFGREAFESLLAEQVDDRELLERVLIAVEGIGDVNGEPLSAEAQRNAVLEEMALGAAAVRGFVESLAGAAGKNSKTSRGR